MHKFMKYFEQASVRLSAFALGLVVYLMTAPWAMAQQASVTVDDVAENIVTTSNTLPGILTGMAYMIGLILCVQGILKLKDHVENPNQNPLRTPVIRFLVGGGLFALPIVSNSMRTLILGVNGDNTFDPGVFSFGGLMSGLLGSLGGLLGGLSMDVNAVLANIIGGVERIPGIITAAAYTIGLMAMVVGLFKLKDHIENPSQTPLRESAIRFVAGGCMFALPVILGTAASLIASDDGTGIMGQIASGLGTLNFYRSTYTDGICDPTGGLIGVIGGQGTTLGDSICGTSTRAGAAPAFLGAISYAFGLVLIVLAILKMRDHVLNPQQVKVSEPVSRLIAGGAFLTLPVAVEAMRSTVTPVALTAAANLAANTGYNEEIPEACQGLDGALACFMNDTLGPIHGIVNFFAFVAGMIFIMIGISRLMKSAQEGAKGPGGIGTMMTFATGGMLISFNELMRAFTSTFFVGSTFQGTKTNAALQYVQGMSPEELTHAHTVISAIIKFMIVVGIISFVRGLFIVRGVAEGGSQASPMSAITHLVGGALAVNLGPLINAVQTTLGITQYGITFT